MLRIAVALVGIPLMLFLVRYGSWPLRALVVALQIATLLEWRTLWSARAAHLFLPGLALAMAGLDAALFFEGHPLAMGLAIGTLAVLLLAETFRRDRTPLANLGGSALYLLYIALPLGLWAVLGGTAAAGRFAPAGALTALLAATWMCDSGAYFTGRSLGRHKLYVAASPNKTVEGLIGGIAASAVVLPALASLGWARPALLDYVALPVIVGLLGQSGDLLESLMKRETHVKDTSTALPGHGGFLDRFDSLLLSTPFFYAYLLLTANA
jgi:phosphatidate cytidylyltransferase